MRSFHSSAHGSSSATPGVRIDVASLGEYLCEYGGLNQVGSIRPLVANGKEPVGRLDVTSGRGPNPPDNRRGDKK
jgi:hypothetical protein